MKMSESLDGLDQYLGVSSASDLLIDLDSVTPSIQQPMDRKELLTDTIVDPALPITSDSVGNMDTSETISDQNHDKKDNDLHDTGIEDSLSKLTTRRSRHCRTRSGPRTMSRSGVSGPN